MRTSRASHPDWPADDQTPGSYQGLLNERQFRHSFRWLQRTTLLESRNDLLERLIKSAKTDIDLVDDERQRWLAAQRAAGVTTLCIPLTGLEEFSFIVLGDTGEADESQYCVVEPLKAAADDTTFMVVMSDVIYPTGEINDYLDAFYLPYRFYKAPIYALPGNHDWYALLTGFMWNFCDAEPLPPATYRMTSYTWQERLARVFWLRSRAPLRARLLEARAQRPPWNGEGPDWAGWPSGAGGWPRQPASYYAIDTETVRIVCIDTGISGDVDVEQATWLVQVSSDSPLPKILLTGKPLYVDNCHKRGVINWPADDSASGVPEIQARFPDVDSIVRNREHNYIAAIGGDVHNYQRYPIQCSDESGLRTLQYVVSGGGGAYLSPTHPIPTIELGEVPTGVTAPSEDEFRCYPLRGDSLARYTREFARQMPRILLWILVPAVLLAAVGARLFFVHTTENARWPAVGLAIAAAAAALLLVSGGWFRLRVRIAVLTVSATLVVALLLWPRWGVAVVAGIPFAGLGIVALGGFKKWKLGLAFVGLAVLLFGLMVLLHGTVYGLLSAWLCLIGGAGLLLAIVYLLPLTLATAFGPEIDPDACARYLADRWGVDPQRRRARSWSLGRLTRMRLWVTFPSKQIGPIYVPLLYSALFDFGTPPFFKNFLRIEVDKLGVAILVYAVSGFRVHERLPRIEDSFYWRARDGAWTTARAVLQPPDHPRPAAIANFFLDETGRGTFEITLGHDFAPGRYRLEGSANFGDRDRVDLGEVAIANATFEVVLHQDVTLPERGWFQELRLTRERDSAERVFYFT